MELSPKLAELTPKAMEITPQALEIVTGRSERLNKGHSLNITKSAN